MKLTMTPIILCGGSGTRLWPISDKKPFYNFFENQSLLEISLKRLKSFKSPVIVSKKSLRPAVESIFKSKGYKAERIYEPISRNTAVSIALACCQLKQNRKTDELIGIFPSDHFISKELDFYKWLSAGIQIAKEQNQIVTFGIPPRFPCSDYGYIKVKPANQTFNGMSFQQSVGFVEKPSLSQSASLIKKGWLWNSGIFLSPLKILIQHFENHLPDLWQKICSLKENFRNIHSVYRNLTPVSFDQGIMEKIGHSICLPCDIGWWDLGSWDRLAEWEQEFSGTLQSKAHVVSKDSQGNFIFSAEDQNIGLIGVKNLLIIQGEKGLLIANKGQGEDVRELAKEFKKRTGKPDEKSADKKAKKKETDTLTNTDEQRAWVKKPWGTYRVLMEKEGFKYKELKIQPGHQLSYQSHRKRSEHWIVMSGQAEVILEGSKQELKINEHIFIPQGVKHRLKNPKKTELLVLEIQTGACLEENDIIRYTDDYGRDGL